MHSFIVYLMYLPKEKQFFIPYLNGVDMFRNANLTCNTLLYLYCVVVSVMAYALKIAIGLLANRLYGRVSAHSLNLSI